MEFCSAEGLDDLYDYCNRPRRTILEVLNDFPHAITQLTINQLFDFMPSIKPRSFSIASSQKVHGDCIVEILVAVVRFKTKLKKDRFGLCSNWLAALNVGSKVPVWITRGSFNFPKLQVSVIIIIILFRIILYSIIFHIFYDQTILRIMNSAFISYHLLRMQQILSWLVLVLASHHFGALFWKGYSINKMLKKRTKCCCFLVVEIRHMIFLSKTT